MRPAILRIAPAPLILAATLVFAGPANAAPDDYRWEAVNPYPQRQVGVVLQVRIRDTAGRIQHGAKILDASFARIDGGSIASVTATPTADFGVYAFKTDVNTDGRFVLSITAQMPFDPVPVTGSVEFTVPEPPKSAAPDK